MKKEIIVECISFLFILLFVYAALTKLMDFEKFNVQISQSEMLMAFSGWVVWGVPAVEIIVSVLLIVSRFRLIGLYASFTLMVIFTAYIIMILNFADSVPCSCGGILEKMGWTAHLIFNIGFVMLALIGVVLLTKREQNQQTTPA